MPLSIELARRHAALRRGLSDLDAVALVAARESTVTYLTGYTTSTWSNFSRPIVAILTMDQLLLVVAETETDAVSERVPGVSVHDYVELRTVPDGWHLPDGQVQFGPAAGQALLAALESAHVGEGVIAVDGYRAAFPPIAQVTDLVDGLDERCVDASDLVWRVRLDKSEWEVDRLAAAAAVLGEALDALRPQLAPGLTERQVHQRFASAAFDAGAHSLGYVNVVAGVQRGLFGAPTGRIWERGEVLYVDGGVLVDGYWADFCRMYTVGKPYPAQAAGYHRALNGLREGIASVTSATTAGDLCKTIQVATDLDPSDVGFGRFGHGLGLYMPEPPSIHLDDTTPLAGNTVLCVEPAVIHNGSNFVVEEEYYFTDSAPRLISPPVPDDLIVI